MVSLAGLAGMQIIISAIDKASITMARVGANANAMANTVGTANKKMLISTKQLGMGFTAIGAAAAIGTALAVKSAMSFESEMTDALMMFGKVSEDTRKEMEQVAISASKDLAIPAGEAAKAFYYLGSAGLDTTTAMGTLPAVLTFARVGLIETADAAEMTMTAMKVFGYEASDATKITDVFMEGVRNAQITTADLSESFKYVAPVAKQLGMSLEETTATIGMLGDAGIRGSMAGTALRRSLLNLAAPTTAQKEMLDELGVSVTDESGNFVGMASILDQMSIATKDMGVTQKAAAMKTIFGNRAVAGMSAIMEMGGDRLRDYTEKLEESTATSEMLADKKKDLRFQIESLKTEFAALGIELGTVLIPILKDTLIPALKRVIGWFTGLSPTMKKVIAIGTLLTAAIGLIVGPILLLLPSLMLLIPTLITVGTAILAFATGPIGLVILAITGLAIAWKTNLFGIQDKTKAFVDKIKEFFEKWKGILLLISGPIGWLYIIWHKNLGDIQGKTESVVNKIKEKFGDIINFFTWILFPIPKLLYTIWEENLFGIRDMISPIVTKIITKFQPLIDLLQTMLGWIEKINVWAGKRAPTPATPVELMKKGITPSGYTMTVGKYGERVYRPIPKAQFGGIATKAGLIHVEAGELMVPKELQGKQATIINQTIYVQTNEQAKILRLKPGMWY